MNISVVLNPERLDHLVRFGQQKASSTDRRSRYWESMAHVRIPLSQIAMVAQYPSEQKCVYVSVTSGQIIGLEFEHQGWADTFAETLNVALEAVA